MSEYFDLDDPFEDLTADDFAALDQAALAATQAAPVSQQLHPPLPRTTSFHDVFPPVQEQVEDDYGQFNVDDEDLLFEQLDPQEIPPRTQPSAAHPSPNNEILEELARLRTETAQLKLERDTYETLAFSQDGKLDHLQRTLSKTRAEHEAALSRLARTSELEKKNLQQDLAERDRKLASLNADIDFQRTELREARELATRREVVRLAVNGEVTSPKRGARVVRGSGVKSPESKSKIAGLSARAFGREESVVPAKPKKRKRDEIPPVIVERDTPEVTPSDISDAEINRIVMERVLAERSMWKPLDERFEASFKRFLLTVAYAGDPCSSRRD
jgi:hypothetical protein